MNPYNVAVFFYVGMQTALIGCPVAIGVGSGSRFVALVGLTVSVLLLRTLLRAHDNSAVRNG